METSGNASRPGLNGGVEREGETEGERRRGTEREGVRKGEVGDGAEAVEETEEGGRQRVAF